MIGPQELAFVGVFQGAFLILLVLSHDDQRETTTLLILPIAVLTLRLLLGVFLGFEPPTDLLAVRLSWASLFLAGPALWLYVSRVSAVPAHPRDFVHFVPAALVLVVLLTGVINVLSMPIWSVLYVQLACYTIAATVRVSRFTRRAQNQVSTISLPRLTGMALVLAAAGALLIVSFVGDLFLYLRIDPWWFSWVPIGTVVFVWFLASYLVVSRPHADPGVHALLREAETDAFRLSDVDSHRKQGQTVGDPKNKYAKNRLGEEVEKNLLAQIVAALEENQRFADMDLKLSDLAVEVDLAPQQVSMVLNLHAGVNFYRFVNRRRVQAVLEQFEHPAGCRRPIIDIALECGFRSKSTFNTVFREITGETPSQYRRRHIDL